MVDGVGALENLFFFWLVGEVAIFYFLELLTALTARHALLVSHFFSTEKKSNQKMP